MHVGLDHGQTTCPHSPFGRRGTLCEAHMPYTFNNRNSRSHELITRKNVSYSLRLTEM
ncbi:hypothetical protein FHY15_002315 [Xanthomonas arboricola]|nr:hypothetical protein [Xanthomonas arboricola]NJC01410.1 hypothetical protein [Xanthomonas arboricola]